MLGKADYHIARLKPIPHRPIAHNKSDVGYVLSRNPAFMELNLPPARFADVAWLQKTQREDMYGYTLDLALDPRVRQRYAIRLQDREGRRVPFAVRADVPQVPWRVPDAFYANLDLQEP
jgi:hypothetical protein